jgi:hypothetical protein
MQFHALLYKIITLILLILIYPIQQSTQNNMEYPKHQKLVCSTLGLNINTAQVLQIPLLPSVNKLEHH